MATASAALLLDPLAEDSPQPTRAVTSRLPGSAKHGETVAPELTGFLAGKAVAAVRALGLIAAIEGLDVSETDRHGVVVEQTPPAGTRLGREGIVILRVGQPAGELTDDDPPILTEIPDGVDPCGREDDTEAWFATLVQPPAVQLTGVSSSSNATATRERRSAGARSSPRNTPTRPRALTGSLLRRTASLLIAGVTLGALTVFAVTGHPHSRLTVSHVSRSAPIKRAPAKRFPRLSRARILPRSRARHATRQVDNPAGPRQPTATTRTAPHPVPPQPAPRMVIQASEAPPARTLPTTDAAGPAGQFSYLGH
jgi:hypothetical protein